MTQPPKPTDASTVGNRECWSEKATSRKMEGRRHAFTAMIQLTEHVSQDPLPVRGFSKDGCFTH